MQTQASKLERLIKAKVCALCYRKQRFYSFYWRLEPAGILYVCSLECAKGFEMKFNQKIFPAATAEILAFWPEYNCDDS